MEGDATRLGESLEELAEELCFHLLAEAFDAETDIPDQKWTVGEIKRDAGQAFIHRDHGVAIAVDPGLVTQSLFQGLAESEACIFHGMVGIDMEIAFGLNREIDQAVAAQLVEHMIEEADARVNLGHARAVEIDGHGNAGFLGLAIDSRGPHLTDL